MDVKTLLIVNSANMVLMALMLPLIMGQRLSVAAKAARQSIIVHAVGWAIMLLSGQMPERWQDGTLSTIAIALFCYGHWLLFQALKAWLGPRPGERLLLIAVVLTPIGYGLAFSSYEIRVGWSNFLLALQLLIVARATLRPLGEVHGPWRWAMLMALGAMAILTFGRGFLGAFTDLYPHLLTPHPWNVAAMLVTNMTLVLANVSVLVAWREEAELELRKLAVTDVLTGVLNRRGWYEVAGPMIAQANRQDLPLALLSLDLDHFKSLNDTLGHETGDKALKLFGQLLTEGRRATDVVARIGGEEFCVLLPMADAVAAQNLDQRLRLQLSANAEATIGRGLDFSSGLALLKRPDETLEQLMARADAALYQAKNGGRGRLMVTQG